MTQSGFLINVIGTRYDIGFVVEHGRRLLALEVKRTTQPAYADAAGLRAFLADHPKTSGGLLLHGGREIRHLDKNIVALPWTVLTG